MLVIEKIWTVGPVYFCSSVKPEKVVLSPLSDQMLKYFFRMLLLWNGSEKNFHFWYSDYSVLLLLNPQHIFKAVNKSVPDK